MTQISRSRWRRLCPRLRSRLLSGVLIGLTLGGCATTPVSSPSVAESAASDAESTADAGPGGAAPSPDQAPEAIPHARPSPDAATLALLQQSERALESGSVKQALAYAERAVRIDPRRADLWTRLAGLELTDGNPETALQYANKALALARDRPDWQRDAWLVIAAAREAMGDAEAASEIRDRWRTGRG